MNMQGTVIIRTDGSVETAGVSTRVPWWSFTKTVLAVAILRLVEDRLLQLDERLQGEAFSTRQLLRHEAGLPDYGTISRYHTDVAVGKRPWSVSRLLEAVDGTRLRCEPGAGWAYSNIGYLRIAQLIESATGSRLATALQKLVFEPACLETARLAVEPDDLIDVQMGDAVGYHPGWVYHGLVVGTLGDAANLLRQLAYGELLKPSSLAAMKEPRALPEYRSDDHPDPGYGLGLMLAANEPDAHPFGHSGAGPGSRIAVCAHSCQVAAAWAASSSLIEPDTKVREILGA